MTRMVPQEVLEELLYEQCRRELGIKTRTTPEPRPLSKAAKAKRAKRIETLIVQIEQLERKARTLKEKLSKITGCRVV